MSTLDEKAKESQYQYNSKFGIWAVEITEHISRNWFKKGFELCQKEYEEKLRWIPVEERLPEIGIWIIIQLKNQSLKNKYVTMLPKNDFEINYIKENVISWRSFL